MFSSSQSGIPLELLTILSVALPSLSSHRPATSRYTLRTYEGLIPMHRLNRKFVTVLVVTLSWITLALSWMSTSPASRAAHWKKHGHLLNHSSYTP